MQTRLHGYSEDKYIFKAFSNDPLNLFLNSKNRNRFQRVQIY